MRRTTTLCAIALIAAITSCQSHENPTGTAGLVTDPIAMSVADGVPNCGFINGPACGILDVVPRCDRGLAHVGGVPPLNLGGMCVNDTRHLVGSSFRGSWTDWALANQRTLAIDEPLNWVMHLTTHNAFNNIADGEILDPNQTYSISDQLDLGARMLWLDLHWVLGQIRLCHALVIEKGPEFHVGCTDEDRVFGYAVKEIADWLRDNPNEILIMDFESYHEGQVADVVGPLNAFLGSKIYAVSDRDDPLRWPSRRELLAQGKQVIIGARGVTLAGLTHSSNYLPAALDIRYIKHFEVTRTSGIVTACFGGESDPKETILQTDQFFRVVGEDRTTFSLLLPASHKWHVGAVQPHHVADLAACGVRLISLDMLESPVPTLHPGVALRLASLRGDHPNRVPPLLINRQEYAVWSWAEGDRGASGDAAVLRGATGRWSSVAPAERHRFACALERSETRPRGMDDKDWPDLLGTNWRVTTREGTWHEGGRACLDEFGSQGYVFAVPVHGLMNGRLRLADGSRPDIWLNYNDIEREGSWVINRRPVAEAGAARTVECTGHHSTPVTLDARGSTDENGHTMTFEWRGPFGTVTGAQPTVNLPLGRHEITLVADDGFGGVDTDIVVITVVDTKPPVIHSATATPSSFWPPNHKMNPVTITVSVTDTCDASPTCRIISVTSNEPVNGKGDGNTEPDWRITGALTLELRAERAGPNAGRVYTIMVQCTDASGNAAIRAVQVTVPHDNGKG